MTESVASVSAWRLRYDIMSVRTMLLLVGGVRREDVKPEIHLYLGDRYERLADHYARRGAHARASRLGAKAKWHYVQGGFDDTPETAAMAMPMPRPRLFTDARGRRIDRGSPPDAA